MENKYFLQTKGIKENKNCWRTHIVSNTLKEAMSHYNFIKGGCCKRIMKITTIKKVKIMRFKKY